MDLTVDLDVDCAPDVLFSWVDDLDRYPEWLEIVTRVERATPPEDDSWLVDLRGRIGRLARSKRLRMVRTRHEAPRAVRFERREDDGRPHSAWTLDASVEPLEGQSRLVMRLRYDGAFGGRMLERMLRDEVERSRSRLRDLASEGG